MSRGINANLLRRWVRLAESQPEQVASAKRTAPIAAAPASPP